MNDLERSPEISFRLKSDLMALQPVSPMNFRLKLLGIHAMASLLTLSICPQFGVDGLKTFFDLSEIFMRLGHTACQAMCGLIYFSITMVIASLTVRREELFYLKRHRALYSVGLVFLSLGFFVMKTSWNLELSIVAAWMAGGTAGAIFSQWATFRLTTQT